VPVTVAPSDRELVELLGGGDTTILSRSPYRYATSAALEQLRVRVDDAQMELILKDLSQERRLGEARTTKPAFLYDPAREIETYRRILAPTQLGPHFFAAVSDDDPPRHWLILEKVPGIELWQSGEPSVWEAVARWLGQFHVQFAQRLDEVSAANPHLLDYSSEWFRIWRHHAAAGLAASGDRRARLLEAALERYEEVVSALDCLPRTLVHGEFYPSNVMVVPTEGDVRVAPVDWEMAAIGPGLIDLAALVGGWSQPAQRRLVTAYLEGAGGQDVDARPVKHNATGSEMTQTVASGLDRCRLHMALQWLGWSAEWTPPRDHARDWLGEAIELAEQLGLT
jgi:aminoglycoside phosphotransferase (APT) family kinase protein